MAGGKYEFTVASQFRRIQPVGVLDPMLCAGNLRHNLIRLRRFAGFALCCMLGRQSSEACLALAGGDGASGVLSYAALNDPAKGENASVLRLAMK